MMTRHIGEPISRREDKLPVKSVKEFIDLARSTPGGLTFSSAGPGSAPFLGMQRFMQASGITNLIHVPYPGSMAAPLRS
jgi:tripartite-type tricarboxylate transporter receptor subunit TctC